MPATPKFEDELLVLKGGARIPQGAQAGYVAVSDGSGNLSWASAASAQSPSTVTASTEGGVPEWAPKTAYTKNQLFQSGGITYIALKNFTSSEPPFAGAGANAAIFAGSGVLTTAALATEPTVYVSKNGSDSNTGLAWESSFATIKKAAEHLEALGGKRGCIEVGVGAWTENVVRPDGVSIFGRGGKGSKGLTRLICPEHSKGNVLQDQYWGSLTKTGEYGGCIDHLAIEGKRESQGAHPSSVQPYAKVREKIAVTTGGTVTLNAYFRGGWPIGSGGGLEWPEGEPFPASGVVWIGTYACEYTSYEKTGTFTGNFLGVKALSSNFTAYPEMLIEEYGGRGNGIAIQGSFTQVGEDVFIEGTYGHGVVVQGGIAGQFGGQVYSNQIHAEARTAGGYGFSALPQANDGILGNQVFSGTRGSLFLGGGEWMGASIHLESNGLQTYGALMEGQLRICGPLQQLRNLNLDNAPYSGVIFDTASYREPLTDCEIDGHCQHASSASAQAGYAFLFYGEQAAERIRIRGNYPGRYDAIAQGYANIYLASVGTVNLKKISEEEGKLQVVNALHMPPESMMVTPEGRLTLSTGDQLQWKGRTAISMKTEGSAAAGATTLKLTTTVGLAASGCITVNRAASNVTEKLEAIRLSYTAISGNEITGIPTSGEGAIPETIASGTGVAQHFLTGITGGTSTAVANNVKATVTYEGTKSRISPSNGTADVSSNLCYAGLPLAGSVLKMRVTGQIDGNPNPFFAVAEIKTGEKEAKIPHGLKGEPKFVYWDVLEGEANGVVESVKTGGTETTIKLTGAATGTMKFSVQAWATSV